MELKLSNLKQILATRIHADIFDFVVAPFFDIDWNLFLDAAESGDLEEARYLHSIGANMESINVQRNALCNAAFAGHNHMIDYLLSIGAYIHEDDDAALIYAAAANQLDTVKHLVSQGANLRVFDVPHGALTHAIKIDEDYSNLVAYLELNGLNMEWFNWRRNQAYIRQWRRGCA
jgi:ankyrin repeat protein